MLFCNHCTPGRLAWFKVHLNKLTYDQICYRSKIDLKILVFLGNVTVTNELLSFLSRQEEKKK
jgi:hypothetical protein